MKPHRYFPDMSIETAMSYERAIEQGDDLGLEFSIEADDDPDHYRAMVRYRNHVVVSLGSLKINIPRDPYMYVVQARLYGLVAELLGGRTMNTIHGYKAIRAAVATGVQLHKYADPTEGAREITIAEACEIAKEDPSLVYCDADKHE